MNTYALLVILGLLAVAAVRIYLWRQFWKGEGRKLQTSGYLPPEPSWTARIFFHLVNRLLVFLSIGPVKVIRSEKYRRYKGRKLVAPNHIQAPDWALVNQGVDYERYTAVTSELRGPRGLFSGWTGCFGVDSKQPNGAENFINACVEVITSKKNSSLLYFPQGKLVADNILRPEDFRPGIVKVARKAASQVGAEPLAIIPVAILYKHDRSQATLLHRLMLTLGQKWFRNIFGAKNFGAVVVVGDPIPVHDLPYDADPEHPHNAIEFLRGKIQELLHVAEQS
jgi:1-acyl-sn-glycerol-3-phosphate acyltransferase